MDKPGHNNSFWRIRRDFWRKFSRRIRSLRSNRIRLRLLICILPLMRLLRRLLRRRWLIERLSLLMRDFMSLIRRKCKSRRRRFWISRLRLLSRLRFRFILLKLRLIQLSQIKHIEMIYYTKKPKEERKISRKKGKNTKKQDTTPKKKNSRTRKVTRSSKTNSKEKWDKSNNKSTKNKDNSKNTKKTACWREARENSTLLNKQRTFWFS